VGHESPGAFGTHQAGFVQAGEVLGDAGSTQIGGGGDLSDGSRTLPQGEQAREAGGIGEAPEKHRQRPGRCADTGSFFEDGALLITHNHASIRYHFAATMGVQDDELGGLDRNLISTDRDLIFA
jgi:hypothetical protein